MMSLKVEDAFYIHHFCGIYGIGATFLIASLRKFKDKKIRLFCAGFAVGTFVEYVLNFMGEAVFETKFWDYSNNFLNINGRVCLLYSAFWGILGIVLVKVINPIVDKLIDFVKSKIGLKLLKRAVVTVLIIIVLDSISSALAVNFFLTRAVVQKEIGVANKEQKIEEYNKIYGNEKISNYIYKHWDDEKVLKAFPNLTVKMPDGKYIYVKNYYPEIKPYYFKW